MNTNELACLANPDTPSLLPSRAADIAVSYQQSGLSVIPVRADGSKAPSVNWKQFQDEIAPPDQIKSWFDNGADAGIGIVCGHVSGDLEVIDIDDPDVIDEFWSRINEESATLQRCLPTIRTPSGGLHIYYRCDCIDGNQKLAERAPNQDDNGKGRTIIETRGEGGYVLAPGSHIDCHEARKEYEHVAGPPLTNVPRITKIDREVLLSTARRFNQHWKEHHDNGSRDVKVRSNRPGDKFNKDQDWGSILIPHGWVKVGEKDAIIKWRRPGKSSGISATTGVCFGETSGELLFVFSSNAQPFEPGSSYAKFAAWAFLEHEGDFSAAARALGGDTADECVSLVTRVIAILLDGNETILAATPDGEAHITAQMTSANQLVSGCRTYLLRSKGFARWLRSFTYSKLQTALTDAALANIVGTLEAHALHTSTDRQPVFTRIGHAGERGNLEVWIDLANDEGEAIQVTANGWSLKTSPEVRFVRPPGQLSLPTPALGGALTKLKELFHLSQANWVLVTSWLIGAFHPHGPYPILCLHGEQGSLKSTLARALRSLIDPHKSPLRAEPQSTRDLMIGAKNNRVLCFDNLSNIKPDFSDSLCRLATSLFFAPCLFAR